MERTKDNDDEIYADLVSDIDSDNDETSSSSDEDICIRPVRQVSLQNYLNDESSDDYDFDENSECIVTDLTPKIHDFIGKPGIKEKSVDLTDIKSCLELFMGDDFIDILVRETNRHYHQNHSSADMSRKKWTDVSNIEMKRFIGLIILMRFVRKSENEYWSTNPLLYTPIFVKTMTRDRFRQIWRYWHFSDNRYCRNRLDKIRPIISYLSQKFLMVYKPEKELVIDENIILWKGRYPFYKYKPTKIIKYGFIVSMVCESTTGYICNLEMSCMQETEHKSIMSSLLNPFLNVWHHIYMNNYYNSVKVAHQLFQSKTGFYGTLKRNRSLPECLKNINLKKNKTKLYKKNNVMIQAWKKKQKLSYMISTIHPPTMVETITSKRKKRVKLPICAIEHKKHTKKTNWTEEDLSYYSILRQTHKWTKRSVIYLINCALFNAYCMYKKELENKLVFKKFLLEVVRELLHGAIPLNIDELESSTSYIRRAIKYDPQDRLCSDMRKHKITKIIGQGLIKNPRRTCRVCSKAKKRSSTRYICSSCKVPLHAGRCFKRYHTLSKY